MCSLSSAVSWSTTSTNKRRGLTQVQRFVIVTRKLAASPGIMAWNHPIGILIFLCISLVNSQDEYYVPFIGERYDTFDWNLVQSLASPTTGNVIISPISVKLALAMLYEASTGSTERQIQDVLSFPISRHATRDRFLQIITSLNSTAPDQTLDIASRIFTDKDLKPHPKYEEILKKHYASQITPVDFSNLEETKYVINNWAQNATHGHVKELVTNSGLKNSIMILANAIYFKGLWRIPFETSRTMSAAFHVSANKTEIVPFMIVENNFYYYDSDDLKAEMFRIPYKSNISMFIILPTNVNDLPQVIKQLNPSSINELRWDLANRTVTIRLPKFNFEYKTKLKETLQELGLNDIFEDIASLPVIKSGNKNITNVKVSNFIQKAGIEVNEEGSTAWATSSFEIGTKFGSNKIVDVNRPFLFYLEDEYTGTVLFVGKVLNPLDSKTLQNDSDLIIKTQNNLNTPSSSNGTPKS